MTPKEWEERMLSLPIAGKVSSEHDVHTKEDPEFQPLASNPHICRCDRCKIIRIKKRRAFRFPRTKCKNCGELFTSLFNVCDKCNTQN